MPSRIAVVTGASRGLGFEFVKQLSQKSTTTVLAVVRDPSTAKELQALNKDNIRIIKGDVTDFESLPKVAEEISAIGGGKVDLLINNAGLMSGTGAQPYQGISQSTPSEWTEQFNTNVLGVVFFTNALIPLLKASTEKKMIVISSSMGDIAWQNAQGDAPRHFSSYSATKAAINLATLKYHHEFAAEKLIFIALSPGWVNTDLGTGEFRHYAPLQPPESVARCLSFIDGATFEDSGKFANLD